MLRTAIVIYLLSLFIYAAMAHDHWINHGKYLDPVTGQHCCNELDCKALTDTDIATIQPTPEGGLIVNGISFQKNQLHKSEDGLWYRCANRCVFRPIQG